MTAQFPASAAADGPSPLAPHGEWDETSGSGHFVQFYEDDSYLLDAVSRFIGTALGSGGAGVVIATSAHRDRLSRALAARGLDVETIRARGRYITLDAADTLSEVLIDGWPDEARFVAVLGGVIERAAAADRDRPVRAFGEMVALLCADGRRDAAIRVEELWNALGQQQRFSLFCAYPINAFRTESASASFASVCAAHAQVIPAESYAALSSADDQLRTVSQLQQQAQALEAESAERKRAQAALLRKQQELEEKLGQLAEIDRRKDEFLAMLGHELRNPLRRAAERHHHGPARPDTPRARPGDRPAAERTARTPGGRPARRGAHHAWPHRASQGARERPERHRPRRRERPLARRRPGPSADGLALFRRVDVRSRSVAPGAGARQPADQRRQVHRAGRTDRRHRRAGAGRGGGVRAGQRHRHPRRTC